MAAKTPLEDIVEELLKEASDGDADLIVELRQMRTEMMRDYEALVAKLDARELPPQACAFQMNELIAQYLKLMAERIGVDKVQEVFGISLDHPIFLVDPEMMDKT